MKSVKYLWIMLPVFIFLFQAAVFPLNVLDTGIKDVMVEERKNEKERRRVIVGENSWLEFHLLLQAQAYLNNIYDPSAGENSNDETWYKGFQIRRAMVMMYGQAAKDITFFLSTDDNRIGTQGPGSQYYTSTQYTDSSDDTVTINESKGTFVQDAFISYKILDELQISIGMMPLPFMHQNRQSPVSLLGIDYNTSIIPLNGISNEWRDTGIEIRGSVFKTLTSKKGLLDYRLGVWRGHADRNTKGTASKSDDININSHPRYCGRIQLNIMDPETGFFYRGNNLGKKNVFSIGGGMDYQNHAVRNNKNELKPYWAWTVDAIFDGKIDNDIILTLQGAFVYVLNSPVGETDYINKQMGFFAQIGVLYNEIIQPVFKYTNWKNEDSQYKKEYFIGGLNYFIKEHEANIKFEYQFPFSKDHKDDPGEKKWTLQCQIFI